MGNQIPLDGELEDVIDHCLQQAQCYDCLGHLTNQHFQTFWEHMSAHCVVEEVGGLKQVFQSTMDNACWFSQA